MKGILKTALIVGGLIFVGMLGLKSMSMIWIDSTPNSMHGHWTADESGRNHFVPELGPRVAVAVQPALSLEWQMLLTMMVLLAFLALLLVALRFAPSRKVDPSVDTVLVHELARRAQDLSQRMEALETILLDRSGQFRETAGRS